MSKKQVQMFVFRNWKFVCLQSWKFWNLPANQRNGKPLSTRIEIEENHKFLDNIESHVCSLQGLGIESKNYGYLLAPIILERLSHQLKLIISRNLKSEI